MDDLDRAILERLREDSRITNSRLGAALELTEGAIRHRLARLLRDQVILRYTVITRPEGPEGLVLIRCQPGRTAEVVNRLRNVVRDLFETSGEYDLAVSLDRSTMVEFNAELDRIRAIPGVQSTATLVRLTRFVGPGTPPGGSLGGAAPARERIHRAPRPSARKIQAGRAPAGLRPKRSGARRVG